MQKNVFISHYGKDDEHIGKLKSLLGSVGYELRNSSIDSSKPNNASNDEYIKGLLRDGISWAGTVLVLIGGKTHTRPWVNWEIEQAAKQGKRIVGIYLHAESGCDVPEAFEKHGSALVGWNSNRIVDAIEGKINDWQNPDGSIAPESWGGTRTTC